MHTSDFAARFYSCNRSIGIGKLWRIQQTGFSNFCQQSRGGWLPAVSSLNYPSWNCAGDNALSKEALLVDIDGKIKDEERFDSKDSFQFMIHSILLRSLNSFYCYIVTGYKLLL